MAYRLEFEIVPVLEKVGDIELHDLIAINH
jgi:hypothetical protein